MNGECDLGGVRLAYRLEGPPAAPVVAFANSLGTTSALFDAEAALLAGRFRVLRYDLRGHGGSSAPPGPYSMADLGGDLIGLLDALGIARASLVGLSIGGMIAQWVAAMHPERVERLVVACSAPALPPADAWHARAAAVRAAGTAPLVETLFARWFTPGFRDAHPEVLERVRAMLLGCDPEGYAGCCEAIAGADLAPALSSVRAPTLVICGVADPVAPPAVGLALADALAHASFLALADAAHLANLNQPARFGAALSDHLAGQRAEEGMAVRRAVLGEDHVARASAGTSAFTAPFQELITRYAWGEIWARPGLERRMRSAITLALLVALGRVEELAFHVPAALRNGLSEEEIQEVLLQCAIYAGVPAANSAFSVAQRVLADAAGASGSEGGPARE